jgi:hypothetical protein
METMGAHHVHLLIGTNVLSCDLWGNSWKRNWKEIVKFSSKLGVGSGLDPLHK